MAKKYFDEYYDYILNDVEPDIKAKKIVFDILKELLDRHGIGDEFDSIDEDIQEEIIENCIEITAENLES